MGLIQKRMSKTGVVGEVFPLATAYELCCGDTAQSRCDYSTFAVLSTDELPILIFSSILVRIDGDIKDINLDTFVSIKNKEALAEALAEVITELGYFGEFSIEIQDEATTPTLVISAKSELELIAIRLNSGDVFGFSKNCPDGASFAIRAFNDTVGANKGNETKEADKPYVENVLLTIHDATLGTEVAFGLTDSGGKAEFNGLVDGEYFVAFQQNYKGGAPFSPPADSPKNISIVDGVVTFDVAAPNAWVDAPNYPLS